MKLRAYRAATDRAACLALFDGHAGGAFRSEERPAFAAFLDDLPGPFFVLETEGGVAACGGWAHEPEEGLASVCWTVVERGRTGAGLGRRLLEAILDGAAARPGVEVLRLETVPETEGFFRRLGFETVATDADGYGPGLPRVEMRRPVAG